MAIPAVRLSDTSPEMVGDIRFTPSKVARARSTYVNAMLKGSKAATTVGDQEDNVWESAGIVDSGLIIRRTDEQGRVQYAHLHSQLARNNLYPVVCFTVSPEAYAQSWREAGDETVTTERAANLQLVTALHMLWD